MILKICSASVVRDFAVQVLTAVQLNGEAPSRAIEIQDKGTDSVLPKKLATLQLLVSETLPQACFRLGLLSSELAAKGLGCGVITEMAHDW